MYCTKCGNAVSEPGNFCTRCGTKVVKAVVTAAATETLGSVFWKRLKHAVILQLQQEAMNHAVRQRYGGDNFWGSATARGNDNGQSGYVDVGGTIVGYDR